MCAHMNIYASNQQEAGAKWGVEAAEHPMRNICKLHIGDVHARISAQAFFFLFTYI